MDRKKKRRARKGKTQQQATRQRDAFLEMGRRLSAARTQSQAAKILVETSDRLFGWHACSFFTYSATEPTVRTVVLIDTVKGRRFDVSSKYDGQKLGLETKEIVERGGRLVQRASKSKAPPGVLPFIEENRFPASLMRAPVRKNDKIIAILSIECYRDNAYNRNDLGAFEALAEHCVGALERIRAEEEIDRLNGQLRQRLDELHRLNEELENRVKERTAQVEAVNRELEAFAYSVSHDLRAPLRSIRGFSEVLLERYAKDLDARGQEFLRRSCESSQHMDKLITDLLNLSRVGRAEFQRQEVNLSELAGTITEEIRKGQPERQVEFVIIPGMVVRGDERLLRIVLDNLFSNAWKFTGTISRPLIEFGRLTNPEPAFFVRDNGVGFDMNYSNRLFGVFQRLHNVSQFPGTGVGLAIAQRIISRHGGRVWAEGAVNRGATFYFTIPDELI